MGRAIRISLGKNALSSEIVAHHSPIFLRGKAALRQSVKTAAATKVKGEGPKRASGRIVATRDYQEAATASFYRVVTGEDVRSPKIFAISSPS